MLTRVDSDGFYATLLETITDYERDDSVVEMANKYVINSKRRKGLRKTAQGHKLSYESSRIIA